MMQPTSTETGHGAGHEGNRAHQRTAVLRRLLGVIHLAGDKVSKKPEHDLGINPFTGEAHHKAERHTHKEAPVLPRSENGAAARGQAGLKPMRFVSLHHHSTFSYLDGFQLPLAHVRRAAELNMSALALTEHGNVSSHVKLEQAAEGTGIKPIFGCEVYTGRTGKDATQRKYHLTLLARDAEGYRSLLRLVSFSFKEGFYYEPTVSWEMLNRFRKGIIVLSGCQGSLLFCAAVGGKLISREEASRARALAVARRFKRVFGENYFIEVQAFPELEETRRANPILASIARELDIRLVGDLDCHYTQPSESEYQQILHNVRGGTRQTLEEQARAWGYKAPLCHPTTDAAVYRRLRGTGLSKSEAIEAIVSTEEIAQQCTVALPRLPTLRYRDDSGRASADVWEDELREGWRVRGCADLPPAQRAQYRRQLKYERDLIERKDYVDYFLVVGDLVRWAKDSGIPVGPARGSAAGSIICWLLRITEVNPMLFPDLVFERFIDESRVDLPDIDLDFDSDRRHEVRQYLVRRYGAECVNNIGTFQFYKSRNSLDDVARVYQVPRSEVESIKELLIERSSGDLRASSTIEDTVEQFDTARDVITRHPELRKSMEIEGNIKGFGVHAAGIVVSNGPIHDVCAVYERRVKDELLTVVSFDKHDAERQGLLKIDLLGLSTMAMIAECLRHTGLTISDLYSLPLDDRDTLEAFKANDVIGIFQFEGRATRYVCGALKPESFKEICDVNALSRPGPLHNGAANEYIDIKRGVRKPEKLHPALDRITANTQYQIVYQEQILKIVREIGNFSWTHAAYIRKIISRKIGEQEFNRQRGEYLAGALSLHEREPGMEPMDEETALAIWGMCITAGSYAFNAAHSVSYGMLAYWTMWLKVHYPEVFYAASLEKSGDKTHDLLRDAAKHGIKAELPRPQDASTGWLPGKRSVRAGLNAIPGIGDKTAARMVEARNGEVPHSWDFYTRVKGIGPKTCEKIATWCAQDDPFLVWRLDEHIASVKEQIASGELRAPDGGLLPRPVTRSADLPYSRGKDIKCVWLGTVRSRNIRDIFEHNRSKKGTELSRDEVRDPDLNEWALLVADDETDQLSLRIDRFKYPMFKEALFGMRLGRDLMLVSGVKPGWVATRQIMVHQMWVIDPTE